MRNEKLPSSWSLAPLDALGLWSGGGTPSKSVSEFWRNGTIPWVSSKDMKTFEIAETEDMITEDAVRNSATSILPTGSILIVTRSGILRHTLPVAVTRIPVTVNQDLKALRPESGMEPRYIAYALKAEQQEILHSCAKDGTTVQSVEFDQLKRFRIAVAPENEQRRIADAVDEILSDLDAGVEALKRAVAKLKLYRASVLKAAVTGELTGGWRAAHPEAESASELLARILKERRHLWEAEQLRKYQAAGKRPPATWKSRYKQPIAPNTTKLPELPKDWCWASLDQLASGSRNAITDGPFGSNLKTEHYVSSGPRVIRLQNIGDGAFVDSMAHISPDRYSRLQKHSVRAGDIIIAGLSEQPPKACVLPGFVGPAIVKADCIRFQAHETLDAQCLMYFLNASPTRERTKALVHGVGRPRLNLTEIRSIVLPLPPVREQIEIAERVDEQISAATHQSADLEARIMGSASLRQAALRHAFTGQLLPQDPSDEPAHVLLERIALERAERAAEARRQKLGGAKRKAGSPARRPPDQQNKRSKRKSRTRDTAKQPHGQAAATA